MNSQISTGRVKWVQWLVEVMKPQNRLECALTQNIPRKAAIAVPCAYFVAAKMSEYHLVRRQSRKRKISTASTKTTGRRLYQRRLNVCENIVACFVRVLFLLPSSVDAYYFVHASKSQWNIIAWWQLQNSFLLFSVLLVSGVRPFGRRIATY